MPPVEMERIIFHWTAGAHKATGFDKFHYHILIEDDGKVVKGTPSIAANSVGGIGKKAYHTLNCNTGSIGVSLCCMFNAVEKPFDAGKYPLTKEQWEKLSVVLAELCANYKIVVSPKTVLSHAEVQVNLGIKQRGKWDIAVLPFNLAFDTAKKCGDAMRGAVQAKLAI
jgi:N-acetyl-anhydromuramyl-L-alanine amidase AmpD